MFFETLRLALRAISRNALRSFLTVLGIVIGVSAVITMVTLGRGATAAVQAQIAGLGTNLLMIRPGQRMGPGGGGATAPPFKESDAELIAAQISGIVAVAPEARAVATAPGGHAEGYVESHRALFASVYRAIAAGGPAADPDYPTFADGLRSLRLGEAIAASAREGRWVDSGLGAAG